MAAVEVPITLITSAPQFVTGDRAFVLRQDEIGKIEVGSPFPDDDIWDYFDGDLLLVHVSDLRGGGSSGGGGTWDQDDLGLLGSVPGSGSNPNSTGHVIVTCIPEQWARILVRFGKQRLTQTPINRTAAFPLEAGNGEVVEVFGVDDSGDEVHHQDFELR